MLEAGGEALALRRALEDAWLHERVRRRWQHFVLSLGETATEALLGAAAAQDLAGVRALHHAGETATDGWALPALIRTVPSLCVRASALHGAPRAATSQPRLSLPPAA